MASSTVVDSSGTRFARVWLLDDNDSGSSSDEDESESESESESELELVLDPPELELASEEVDVSSANSFSRMTGSMIRAVLTLVTGDLLDGRMLDLSHEPSIPPILEDI